MTKAIVLSVMGTEAHRVIAKIQSKDSLKDIDGEKMLKYFKRPFSVFLS